MVTRRELPAQTTVAEREMRDQEVLRANRELASYFKGQRTEREARAALKIIKAFVRARERQDPRQRSPLPSLRRQSIKHHKKSRPKQAPLPQRDDTPIAEILQPPAK